MLVDSALSPAGRGSDWHDIIADCLEAALNVYISGAVPEIAFVPLLAAHDALLYDVRNVNDPELRAAWNFGDYFAFCAEHGDPNMCHIPWPDALELGRHIVADLRQRRPLSDERAVGFAYM